MHRLIPGVLLISCALFIAATSTASAFQCKPVSCTLNGAATSAASAFECKAADNMPSETGPTVDIPEMCLYFKHHGPEKKKTGHEAEGSIDKLIVDNLKLHVGDAMRSIALIIGNSEYPQMVDTCVRENSAMKRDDCAATYNLPPAGYDVRQLFAFLKDDQSFDEIIVLQNDTATKDNIRYFLESYLMSRATQFKGKARILIAYSGHGTNPTKSEDKEPAKDLPPSLVLSNAKTMNDYEHSFPLNFIRADVENLTNVSFHVLALINACWAGAIFDGGQGGCSNYDPQAPGSHIVTAGADDTEVLAYSDSDVKGGSMFFHQIIDGIRKNLVDNSNELISTSNELPHFLYEQYKPMNDQKEKQGKGPRYYDYPYCGMVFSAKQITAGTASGTRGGFFFYSPQKPNGKYSAADPQGDQRQRPVGGQPPSQHPDEAAGEASAPAQPSGGEHSPRS
jgi:Caspase domain